LAIAKSVRNQDDDESISSRLRHWQERKLDEFKFVAAAVRNLYIPPLSALSFFPGPQRNVENLFIGRYTDSAYQGTLLAAAVIGCFSWPKPSTVFWLGPACWYSSLVLSLFSVLLSSSEAFVFTSIRKPSREMEWRKQLAMVLYESAKDDVNLGMSDLSRGATPTGTSAADRELQSTTSAMQVETGETPVRVSVRWNMVFTWQAPIMLMSYSVVFFLTGLTIYVLTPLYDGREFDGDSRVSTTIPYHFYQENSPRRC
jgi:hypothetical protein